MTALGTPLDAWLAEIADADLASVIADIAAASLEISALVRGGELSGPLGEAGASNVQGETQKKLDVLSNDLLRDGLSRNPRIAAIASEEEDHSAWFGHAEGRYLVAFDPLDGSSNIDVNVTIGTIFSVLPRGEGPEGDEAFLQPGTAQHCAGYFGYGPQTVLVLALNGRVVQFTLSPTDNRLLLTHENIRLPAGTRMIGANISNMHRWEPALGATIATMMKDGGYNQRWVGSMIADVHRILHQGGLFLYPFDTRQPKGKLRVLYECSPMSAIIECAGGKAISGTGRILDLQPTALHQRTGLICGDAAMVEALAGPAAPGRTAP
ncbi:MAG: class 1 fructose-bisphosphatase [Devosia sp.]